MTKKSDFAELEIMPAVMVPRETFESMFEGPGPGDPAPEGAQTCRECGCWQLDACWDDDRGPCWWVEEDLCSHCEPKVKVANG